MTSVRSSEFVVRSVAQARRRMWWIAAAGSLCDGVFAGSLGSLVLFSVAYTFRLPFPAAGPWIPLILGILAGAGGATRLRVSAIEAAHELDGRLGGAESVATALELARGASPRGPLSDLVASRAEGVLRRSPAEVPVPILSGRRGGRAAGALLLVLAAAMLPVRAPAVGRTDPGLAEGPAAGSSADPVARAHRTAQEARRARELLSRAAAELAERRALRRAAEVLVGAPRDAGAVRRKLLDLAERAALGELADGERALLAAALEAAAEAAPSAGARQEDVPSAEHLLDPAAGELLARRLRDAADISADVDRMLASAWDAPSGGGGDSAAAPAAPSAPAAPGEGPTAAGSAPENPLIATDRRLDWLLPEGPGNPAPARPWTTRDWPRMHDDVVRRYFQPPTEENR